MVVLVEVRRQARLPKVKYPTPTPQAVHLLSYRMSEHKASGELVVMVETVVLMARVVVVD
jgi:hypothetical protein